MSSADNTPTPPETELSLNEHVRTAGEISGPARTDEQISLPREVGGTPKMSRRERRRIRLRDFNKKWKEREKRGQAELERIAPAADNDADNTAVVAASSPDDGSNGDPEDAVIPWASFAMLDAKQRSDGTAGSVASTNSPRADAPSGSVRSEASKERSQPSRRVRERRPNLRGSGCLRVKKYASTPKPDSPESRARASSANLKRKLLGEFSKLKSVTQEGPYDSATGSATSS